MVKEFAVFIQRNGVFSIAAFFGVGALNTVIVGYIVIRRFQHQIFGVCDILPGSFIQFQRGTLHGFYRIRGVSFAVKFFRNAPYGEFCGIISFYVE